MERASTSDGSGASDDAASESDRDLMEWGDLAAAAKAAGSMAPAWKKFIKTKFFVAIERSQDDDPRNYLLNMVRGPTGAAILPVSEVRGRLDDVGGHGIISLSGADLVLRIDDGASIEVRLGEGSFPISKKRVEWLRSGIKVTKGRIVNRKRLQEAAPAAPLPVLSVAANTVPVVDTPDAPLRLPPLAPVLRSQYVKPVLLSLAAVGGLAAAVVFLTRVPAESVVQVAPQMQPAPQAMNAPTTPAGSAPLPVPVSDERSLPFSPLDNSFTVHLPGRAEEVELTPEQVDRLGEARSHQYRLQFEDRTYHMESTDYMDRAPQDTATEMSSIQESVVGDGSLIRSKAVALRGTTGREVRVQLPGGGERAARFAFIGSKFCMVMVTTPNGARDAAQIEVFLNSFQLH